jgi:hypothetical protein
VATGKLLRGAAGVEAGVIGLDISPDGKLIATAGYDGRVKLWDGQSAKHLRQFGAATQVFYCLAFSRDGKALAAGDVPWSVSLYNVENGSVIWKRKDHSGAVRDVTFLNDRRLLSASIDGSARVWDVKSGESMLVMRDFPSDMYRAQISPDGQTLACCGVEPRVSLRWAPLSERDVAENWITLFADDFERADLGDKWQPLNGAWTIENGAARGVYGPEIEDPNSFAATLVPRTKMPASVEVSYDVWSPDVIDWETKLHSPSERTSLIAVHVGIEGSQFCEGEQGFSCLVQHNRDNYQQVASRVQTIETGRKYHVRAVRSPGRWQMYVDGRLVLDATLAYEHYLPDLRIQGTHGKKGDAIYIDNVVVRAPNTTTSKDGRVPRTMATTER